EHPGVHGAAHARLDRRVHTRAAAGRQRAGAEPDRAHMGGSGGIGVVSTRADQPPVPTGVCAMTNPFVPNRTQGLEPKLFWDAFFWLCEIPRVTFHETQVIANLRAGFESLGFRCRVDRAGNLCVRVPATPGSEHALTTVLQGHIDMVAATRD